MGAPDHFGWRRLITWATPSLVQIARSGAPEHLLEPRKIASLAGVGIQGASFPGYRPLRLPRPATPAHSSVQQNSGSRTLALPIPPQPTSRYSRP